MNAAMYAFPWAFRDLDKALSTLKDMGCSAVTVAVAYHAGKFIQPTDARQRVYFPEDGTVYFRPRGSYVSDLQPKVAAETERRDVLAELCARDDLETNAWVVLNHNTRVGMLRPDVCVRNAFGDIYPYALCPTVPAVREYAANLCADVATNYPVRGLLLESPGFLVYAHGFHHEFAQVPPSPWLDALLGLCFCPYCREGAQRAGVDVETLSRGVRSAIDSCFASPQGKGEVAGPSGMDAELTAFHQWRCHTVTSLVAEIRARVPAGTFVKVIGTCQRTYGSVELEGHDLGALSAVCDGLELPLYQSGANAILREAATIIPRLGHPLPSVIIRPGYPDISSSEELGQVVRGVAAMGVRTVSFYNFGMLLPGNLEWVKQALQ